ncbi:hypothetical protein lerEdw1_005011 [Lerista edwardsae]|nr:hypothetical protein lerEdw1_005011 [Lerista edwardsae]
MEPGSSGCRRRLLLLSLLGLLTLRTPRLVTSGQNVTAVARAGSCPETVVVAQSGNCTEECQSDASCEEHQKCCPTSCGTSCQTPNDKPGLCPEVHPSMPQLSPCYDTCKADSDCPGSLKCCRNSCGNLSCSIRL